MTRFTVSRLALAGLTVLCVSILAFCLAQVIPGNIGRTILGPYAAEEQVQELNHELGVDRPLVTRYADWIGSFATGDWGESHRFQVPVRPLVLDRLLNSLILGAYTLLLVVPLSVVFGVLAGLRAGSLSDRLFQILGYSFIALPEFVVGVFLIVVFAVNLGWFPAQSTVPSLDIVDVVRQLTLPAIPMLAILFAYIGGIARSGTVETIRQDYVRSAILKGLSSRQVLTRHILRNALPPTVTVIAVQAAGIFTGLVVIETLFNYPGIAKLTLDSAIQHDIPVFAACTLVIALVLIVLNLIADLLLAVLDPRVRLGRGT
jgi:peptide/nickel transport system permease protein